jgi:hypothetical protein
MPVPLETASAETAWCSAPSLSLPRSLGRASGFDIRGVTVRGGGVSALGRFLLDVPPRRRPPPRSHVHSIDEQTKRPNQERRHRERARPAAGGLE